MKKKILLFLQKEPLPIRIIEFSAGLAILQLLVTLTLLITHTGTSELHEWLMRSSLQTMALGSVIGLIICRVRLGSGNK